MIDAAKWRSEFPALQQEVHGKPLVYLDNAATTQKPRVVLDAIKDFDESDNSNVHRSGHALSARATERFEGARAIVAQYLSAQPEEIIFTSGTTAALNLLAWSWSEKFLKAGDRILLTEMEHHSNLVPWQLMAARKNVRLEFAPVVPATGLLDFEKTMSMIRSGVKLFSFVHIANALGTVNPAQEFCRAAAEAGVTTIVDAAQSAGHLPFDVGELGCDFLAFSGHKVCGPTGIGVLYGRRKLLEEMPPFLGGGEMITRVTLEGSEWKPAPYRFEAGTPPITQAVGLGVALKFLSEVGLQNIFAHDRDLVRLAWAKLREVPGVKLLGPDPEVYEHAASLSFTLGGVHAHDVVTYADSQGVALRGGHHCNQPLMKKLGLTSSARASFYFYNTPEDVGRLVSAIAAAANFFK
ncbi:MAG: aminotransferase class V-fold PLP-dependent enzyme [Verrucomicrobiales bacterium]